MVFLCRRLSVCLSLSLLFLNLTLAQSLPDSLRQPVAVYVEGEEDVATAIRQYLELYLITHEAMPVQREDAWQLQVRAVEHESDSGAMVALSMLVTHAVFPTFFGDAVAKLLSGSEEGDVESGDWIAHFQFEESLKSLRTVHMHDVVLVEASDLEAGCAELIQRFDERHLASINQTLLRRLGRH